MVLHLLILSLACAYVTRALLLTEKSSHEGPFKTPNHFVVFPGSGHTQRVCLFDWIRRIFGVYRVQKDQQGTSYWVVQMNAAERWTCPFCLAFWVAIPFTAFVFVTLPELREWVIAVHLALGSASTVGYGLIERSLS